MPDLALAQKLLRLVAAPRAYTHKRYANLARLAWQHFITRPDIVTARPMRLVIDPSSHCNLRCPLCPTGQGRGERPRARMHFEDFARIIDELGETLFEVDLFGWGEPLLNPELPRMIAYAAAAGVRTATSSHLNVLREDTARGLVDAGLDRLIVSLDGATQETYARYRVGGHLPHVLDNVALVRRARGRRKAPKLVWQFLIMKHNAHEVAQAKRSFRSLGFDALSLRPVRTDMGREVDWSDAERIDGAAQFLPSDGARYDLRSKRRRATPSTCLFLWTQAVIDPRGSVAPCCAIYDSAHDVGSVANASFSSVWNNQQYRELRRRVRARDTSTNGPCGTCIRHGFIEY